MTNKLTTSQAYANQVLADRRAAAYERRGSVIAADNRRLNDLFKLGGVDKVAEGKKTRTETKKVRWTSAELDFLIGRYLAHFVKTTGLVNHAEICAEFAAKFSERGTAGVHMTINQIRGLDTWVDIEGLSDTSKALVDKLYAIDPERFPAGETRQGEMLSALDQLLAELR